MIRVGLTGGIGCGKSAAVKLFQEYDIPVIDADRIAKELVMPGEPSLQAISEKFGERYIQSDGHLNRALLKKTVFSNDDLLEQLESILHPAIRQRIVQQMDHYQAEDHPYIIVDVPLLVEKGYQDLFDEVIVVDCTESQQLQRVSARDQLDNDVIQAIMDKQATRKERLEIATKKLDNTRSIKALAHQIAELHKSFTI